ncbi:MAG: N-acetylmuramoyl-L-alanine amidase [Alphaproteobacteria bacterium]|nr:N-acetylmuramoyl-L-alanine amidase [Alphaproteobacteria bacterium]
MIIDNSYCQERYYGPRSRSRNGQQIDMLIMHTTESSSFDSTAATFTQQTNPPVSAHYVVDRDGKIYCFCPEDTAANHAGKSSWRLVTGEEVRNINQRSIGIEFQCGPGEEITPEQAAAGLWLTKDIMSRNPNIQPENVVGHSDIAPSRKADPGMSFPWELWVQNGLATNATRRGNDGRSSQMSEEMMLAYQKGYFNVNNYTFENTRYLTESDVQNQLAQRNQQNRENTANTTSTSQEEPSLASNIFEMLLSACIGKIAGGNAVTATLASAAMKSLTNESNQETNISSPLENINNILG